MNIQEFTDAMINITAGELNCWRHRFHFEQMRVFNMGCYPWHGYLEPSFLTVQELFDEEICGKYAVGDWRLYDFTSSFAANWVAAAELGKWMRGVVSVEIETEDFLDACARAVTSSDVRAALEKYNLTPDFEVAVFHPDDNNFFNYCTKFLPSDRRF